MSYSPAPCAWPPPTAARRLSWLHAAVSDHALERLSATGFLAVVGRPLSASPSPHRSALTVIAGQRVSPGRSRQSSGSAAVGGPSQPGPDGGGPVCMRRWIAVPPPIAVRPGGAPVDTFHRHHQPPQRPLWVFGACLGGGERLSHYRPLRAALGRGATQPCHVLLAACDSTWTDSIGWQAPSGMVGTWSLEDTPRDDGRDWQSRSRPRQRPLLAVSVIEPPSPWHERPHLQARAQTPVPRAVTRDAIADRGSANATRHQSQRATARGWAPGSRIPRSRGGPRPLATARTRVAAGQLVPDGPTESSVVLAGTHRPATPRQA